MEARWAFNDCVKPPLKKGQTQIEQGHIQRNCPKYSFEQLPRILGQYYDGRPRYCHVNCRNYIRWLYSKPGEQGIIPEEYEELAVFSFSKCEQLQENYCPEDQPEHQVEPYVRISDIPTRVLDKVCSLLFEKTGIEEPHDPDSPLKIPIIASRICKNRFCYTLVYLVKAFKAYGVITGRISSPSIKKYAPKVAPKVLREACAPYY